jgi:hypothetical protein
VEDFRIATSWRTHRKRKRLKSKLGAEGVLALEDLWSYCASEHTDGRLEGMTREDIGAEIDYDGDIDEFIEVLLDLRLIDDDYGTFVMHNWEKRQPYVFGHEGRSDQARRAAKARWDRDRSK